MTGEEEIFKIVCLSINLTYESECSSIQHTHTHTHTHTYPKQVFEVKSIVHTTTKAVQRAFSVY